MEFKQLLQKLKYSNQVHRLPLTKETIANISRFNKTELLIVLESLYDTPDMEYKVKLISILTAYLLFNNKSSRNVIIKSLELYDTLRMFLVRGLPLKTTITLNFITSLLYAEDDGESRSRTLTLHAQNLIRSSGCLTAMTNLFMNYMLHTETWQALCRCLAEVCRGSQLNQNFCSHLVPLCVQRCLRGNLDVILVLQSLLFNHKRNTNLFMETDGPSIFNRRDHLRLEACLQLLNTVIQNGEVEAVRTMSGKIRENLEDLLKICRTNLRVVQWTTIVLYYLDSKLKENDKFYKTTETKSSQNTLHMNSNVNDTQNLFQNIMTEMLSYPPKKHIPLNNLSKVPSRLSNIYNISNLVEETKLHQNNSNNLDNTLPPAINSYVFGDDKLSFSFLMDENLKSDLNSPNNRNSMNNKLNIKPTDFNNIKFNQSRESRENTELLKTFKVSSSKGENITNFKPTFASTPKKIIKTHSSSRNSSTKTFMKLSNRSRARDRTIIKNVRKKIVLQEKHDIKHKSMSSRLFDAINESCTTLIRSVKNVFSGKSSNVLDRTKNKKPYCSYSFTNYMNQRKAELMKKDTNEDVSNEMNTFNTVCNTCDDTFLLQQKFASDEHLKFTVKKLKLGINLYGCDFKRISKTMWPREAYMTPNVLYNLYRKLLLK